MAFEDTPIEKFSYDAQSKTLSAEASTLGWAPGKFPKTLMVKSRKRVLYQRATQVSANPGGSDVVYVEYRPTAKSVEFTPACKEILIKVFNT